MFTEKEVYEMIDDADHLDDAKANLLFALTSRINIVEKYNELIMAVVRKFSNESRHETALKYIKCAENQPNDISGELNSVPKR